MATPPGFPSAGETARPAALGWTELGDALWLAAVAGAAGAGADQTEDGEGEPPAAPLAEDVADPPADQAAPTGSPDSVEDDTTILGPAPPGVTDTTPPTRPRPPATVPALPGGRDIARALRPFNRRLLSPVESEADEEATAERGAEDGLWLPQTRPTPSRWLSVALVIDETATMAVWAPTIAAFRQLIEHHGAFRNVRQFRLLPRGQAAVRLRGPGTGPRDPAELVDPTGRQIVLILTDGLDEAWGGLPIAKLLRLWGSCGPIAIVNPYPQTRWGRGHLAPRRVLLRAPRAAAPNGQLTSRTPDEWRDPFAPRPRPTPSAMAVPVLELNARWLWWWANLVASPPAGWVDAVATIVDPSTTDRRPDHGDDTHGADEDPANARELVLRFRAGASPLAFALATYFAAAPLDLPFLRTLQGLMLPESLPVHLAEVLTSELVRVRAAESVRRPGWEFVEGVREALLTAATREQSARVVRAVGAHYGEGNPAAETLVAALDAPDVAPDSPVNRDTLRLVRIELAVLRALSGPYTDRALRLGRSIAELDPVEEAAVDVESGEAMPTQGEGYEEGGRPSTSDPDVELGYPELAGDLLLDEPVGGARPVVWGNVPPRNQFFTGRRVLLQRMEERLRTEKLTAVLPQALHGMGGVGKSQVAIEYAYRHRTEYDVVWWIPSEQLAQILSALIELGQRLDLDVGLEANTAVPAVLDALRAGVPYDNWLLVFDNAENLEAVREYLPVSGPGRVLVTSRNAEWSRVAETLEVDLFSRQESIGLLRRRDPDVSQDDADQLAAALGDLPLAVEQASTWRATTGMAVQDYLQLLLEKRTELLDLASAPGYELPVAAAWNVALDRLGVENPAALQLLQVLAFFAPEPIARDLLTGPRYEPIAEELDEALQNPSKLGKAIRDIQRYGLARVDHRTNTVQLHRLVNVVLSARMTAAGRADMEHGAHVLLAGGNPGSPDNPRQWSRYQQLVPHVIQSKAITCADAWARELVLDIIEFHYYWGDFNGCRELSRQVMDQWRAQIGPDDPQTLRAAKWLGYVSIQLGAISEAAEINADCLERLERTVGQEDEQTLDALILVALDKRGAGDFSESLRLDQEAFRRSRGALGDEDPITLRAAHALAVSLRLNGEFRQALALDNQTYRRWTGIYGDKHLLTLLTLNGLTLDQRECGAYLEAHALQERVYERFQAVFGAGNPNCSLAARNLAVVRRRAGLHESALKLAEDTVMRNRKHFGFAHHETIAATLNLAVDLRVAEDFEQALTLAEQALDYYHNSLGPAHPYALYARTNLAIVLRLLGETEAATQQDLHAYERLTQKLGPDHVITLTCAINLASDRAELGDHDAAYTLDVDTLRRSRTSLGPSHPTTLACQLNLSLDLDALRRPGPSIEQHRDVLDRFRRVFGADHPASIAAAQKLRANCDADPMPL